MKSGSYALMYIRCAMCKKLVRRDRARIGRNNELVGADCLALQLRTERDEEVSAPVAHEGPEDARD